MIKTVVSCAGRFHSYNLAAQLERQGMLDNLITTYPKSEVVKYGVSRTRIHSLLLWEIINRAWAKWSNTTGMNINVLDPSLNEVYDHAASMYLPNQLDCYIGWSARSEHQIKKAKARGAVTILERGSSHVLAQLEVLKDEFQRYSAEKDKMITHPAIVEKELREYELADYISVPSTFVRDSFIRRGVSPDKVIQNAYGVDTTHFTPGPKPDNKFRVIHVGQLSLRKGVHYLLEAFARLALPDAELLLVGGKAPEIDPFLNKYDRNVRYEGIRPQHELYKFYRQATVFVLCSIEEGMAMVQAQAAACGLPVICTTNTGGADLIEDGKQGFVIPIRDVPAIMEKIQWMYDHRDEAREMGRAARERITQGYSWDDYGNRYADNIQSILERKGR